MKLKQIIFIIIFLYPIVLNSKGLIFNGLERLNLADIQILTSIDIFKKDFNESEINTIQKELYDSDQIYEINESFDNENYILNISESPILQSIIINGNIFIKDDVILKTIKSKTNFFLNSNLIKNDMNLIKNIYKSQGYDQASVSAVTEKYSDGKVNLIFEVNEGDAFQLKKIKFFGNYHFSSKFLSSILNVKDSYKFNIFSTNSNFNQSLIENDKNKIIDYYRKAGFTNVEVSYLISKNQFNVYSLNYYIIENKRSILENINFNFSEQILNIANYEDLSVNFKKKVFKNKSFFDYNLIYEFSNSLNFLISSNNINREVFFEIELNNDKAIVNFFDQELSRSIISEINIYGNTITKSEVILSKVELSPGDYISIYRLNESKEILEAQPYINQAKYSILENNGNSKIDFEIDENKKTGNFLVGASITGDIGVGAIFKINDTNFLGSGNEINSNFSINSEEFKYEIDYIQNPLNNSKISNRYSALNINKDLSSSFGFELEEQSISYALNFDINKNLSSSLGIKYSKEIGHSPQNNDLAVTDNIGTYYNAKLEFSLSNNSTNDPLYPSSGFANSAYIEISPNKMSDNSYIKGSFYNENYFKLKNSNNYFFINNMVGAVESLNKNKNHTYNSFSLGGNNFKGFDYRGIGSNSANGSYLGGNRIYSTIFGYGSTFIFDQTDNIYFRIFYSTGSLWGDDYQNTKFKIRSSIGISFDILTPVGPISFSYAVPIEKETEDSIKKFNFSIGTSF